MYIPLSANQPCILVCASLNIVTRRTENAGQPALRGGGVQLHRVTQQDVPRPPHPAAQHTDGRHQTHLQGLEWYDEHVTFAETVIVCAA